MRHDDRCGGKDVVDRKEHKTSYIKWIVLFISLYAIIIAIGIWASQRDAQREAERKYEFNIIQSIIKDVALYQEEIGNWGYQVSAVMPDEEPEDEEVLKTVRLELAKRNRNHLMLRLFQ